MTGSLAAQAAVNTSAAGTARAAPSSFSSRGGRLDYLDAARAFALVLGVAFHASLSFMPVFIGWAIQDISTSPAIATFALISHSFRMETFFLLAGFFSCVSLRRKGAGGFVRSRMLRIAVPFVASWFLLRPLLVSGWIMGSASLRGDYDFGAGIQGGFESLKTLPSGLFTGSHLWFLYYLALITVVALLLRGAVMKASGPAFEMLTRRASAVVARLAKSPLALAAFAAPTAGALWFMRSWGMDTPDQSMVPRVPVLLVYGGFFALGWLLGHQPEAISGFTRLSWQRWLVAGASLAGSLTLIGISRDPGHPRYFAAHIGFVASYALMMWSLVFLTVGMFRRWFQQPRAWVRYIADSSYWMYLIHLPIVVWLQVAMAEVAWHWSLKLALISVATIAASLVSYDLFVRSTWIGWLLNGRRRRRALV